MSGLFFERAVFAAVSEVFSKQHRLRNLQKRLEDAIFKIPNRHIDIWTNIFIHELKNELIGLIGRTHKGSTQIPTDDEIASVEQKIVALEVEFTKRYG